MDFVALEEELDMLENVCEVQAMERDKTHHVVQLVNYCKNKEAEAMAVKGKGVNFQPLQPLHIHSFVLITDSLLLLKGGHL